jgi:hypothetical protein
MWTTSKVPPLQVTGATTTPTLPVPEMACNGSLLVDELSMVATTASSVTLQYPLSQAELVFVLKTLGIGSQAWTSSPGMNNLPKVTALAGGLSGG